MKKILLTTIFLWYCCASFGQTITDGLLMPKGALCTGFVYGHDEWTKYWEGTLNRKNGNVGTVSTRSLTWMGNYGVLPKLNVIAMVPYIWTKATGGTMRPMEGIQDLTLAAKYELFKQDISNGKLKGFGVLAFSTPLTNYTPDFLPLSIGLATTNLSYRINLNYALKNGIYVNGSTAYTWRSNTTLDRATYYTDGKMLLTSEVQMPNVFDYLVNVGYHKGALQVDVNYVQMVTLGGGDIRRQDMPFASNRMNSQKIGAFVMYYLAKPQGLAVRVGASQTIAGRNVGQTTGFYGGLLYTIRFIKPSVEPSSTAN